MMVSKLKGIATKELYPESLKTAIREELMKLINEKTGEFTELKAVFDPLRMKADLRMIIKNETEKIFLEIYQEKINDIRREMFRSMESAINEGIKMKIKEVSLPDEVQKVMKEQLSQNFKPIIITSINLCHKNISDKIDKKMKALCDLKTSTLMEVKNEVKELQVKQDEDYVKELEEDKKLGKFSGDERYLEWFKDMDGVK